MASRPRLGFGRESLVLLGVSMLLGCTAAASPTPSSSDPAPGPVATASSSAIPSVDATVTPSPTVPASPSAPAIALRTDWIAETIVDGVRMRSLPSTTDPASERYEPLLRTGAMVYVVAGPVAASGYSWYQVLSLNDGAPVRSGWLAAASREGTVWLRDATLDCPARIALFEDFAGLANPGGATALACYARDELQFLAQVTSCNCTASGPPVTPDWLGGIDRTTYRLTAPASLEAARRDITPAFHPDHFDLSALSEPDLPAGVYTVTGHYDDPAAATCEGDPAVGLDPVAQIGACRMTLVITHIEAFEG